MRASRDHGICSTRDSTGALARRGGAPGLTGPGDRRTGSCVSGATVRTHLAHILRTCADRVQAVVRHPRVGIFTPGQSVTQGASQLPGRLRTITNTTARTIRPVLSQRGTEGTTWISSPRQEA